MSTTIDERIVSMQFDNKNFESNVQTSMSTLDKLKQKLHLGGASKGLEEVSKSAKKVDLSPVGKSAEAVQVKFTAMQTIADQALRNITNSAMAAGKKIVSALTIDPIKTGFQEYETQINATQTILANTKSKGSTIDDVNKALEELNKYADMTIYNFTEMTRNIGTFTAAGVDLDTSVNAIQGIANLAAVSGSTSQQASTAMYQLSQALSSGTVKLMDWNSVVNAGMGGQVFQDALKETSKALGTGAEAAIKAKGSFRESLQTGWLTSKVLTETLKKFTSSGAVEEVAKYTGLSAEVVNETLEAAKAKYGEADAIKYASEALAEKSGKNKQEIQDTLEFAQTATDAATKVKTFTQLFDVMKEAAQSGWAQTWKILVGDFEEAKALFTPLADFFTGIINKTSEWRNKILELAMSSPVFKLVETLGKLGAATDELTGSMLDYDKLVDEIIAGKWKNAPTRWQDLAAAGYDWAHAQNLVNERLGCSVRHATNYSESTAKAAKSQQAMADAQKYTLEQLAAMTDEELRALGYSDDYIAALRELKRIADLTGYSMQQLYDNPELASGRNLLINAFKNIGEGMMEFANLVKKAWQAIFPPKSIEERAAQLYNLIGAFRRITTPLRSLIDDSGKLSTTGDKIMRTFKGIFALIDIVGTITGSVFKIALYVVQAFVKAIGFINIDILGFTANVGDAIVKLRDWIDEHNILKKAIDVVVPIIVKLGKAIVNLAKQLWKLPAVQKVVDKLSKAFNKMKTSVGDGAKNIVGWFEKLDKITLDDIGNALKKFGKYIGDVFSRINDHFGGVPGDIFAGLINGLKNGAKKAWSVIGDVAQGLIDFFKKILGIHSPSTVFLAIGGFIIAGLVGGLLGGESSIGAATTGIVEKIKGVFSSIDWGSLFAAGASVGLIAFVGKIAGFLGAITAPMEGIGNMLSGAGKVLEGAGVVMIKSAGAIRKVIKNSAKVVRSVARIGNAMALKIAAESAKSFAMAILMIVAAVFVLTKLNGPDMWAAIGAVAVLMGLLVGLMVAITKFGGAAGTIKFGSIALGIMGIASALMTVALAMALLSIIPKENMGKAIGALAIAVLALVGLVAAMGIFVKGKTAQNAHLAGKLIKKIASALLVMTLVVAILGLLPVGVLIQGGIAMVALGGIVVGLIAATNLAGSPANVARIGKTIKQIATALFMMTLVVVILGSLSIPTLVQGVLATVALGGIVVGLIAATKLVGGKKNAALIGKTIQGIGIALLMMALVVKILGGMEVGALIKGVVATAALAAVIAGLIAATKLAGRNTKGLTLTLIGISLAILIMAAIAVVLGLVPVDKLAKGVIAVGILAGLITLLINSTRNARKVEGAIKAIALCIAILAVAAIALTFVDPVKLAISVAALSALLAMLAVVIKAAKFASKSALALLVISATVIGLGVVLLLLSKVPVANALGSAIALSVLMLAMVGVLKLLAPMKSVAKKAMAGAQGLMALIVPLIGFAIALRVLSGADNLIQSAIALSILTLAMTEVLKQLGKANRYTKKALNSVWALTALAVPLAAFTAVLFGMSFVSNAIPSVIALSALTIAMTEVLIALGAASMYTKQATKGILGLSLLAIPLALFVGVLWLMSGVENATQNALALIGLMVAMSLVLAAAAVVGALITATGGGAALGIAALAALIVPMALFIGALALIGLIDDAQKNANILINMMSTLTDLLVKISILAPLAVLGVAALTALSALVTVMAVVVTAFGALMTAFPDLERFIDAGIPVLVKLAGGLGEMISAFVGGLLSGLPEIGLMLSQFMLNATPFIAGCQMVNGAVLEGVGILTAAILALGVASFIDSILSFLSFGNSFADVGAQLSAFMTNALPFITTAMTINPAILQGVKAMAEAILILTASNLVDGIAGFFTGTSSLAKFGSELTLLGKGLRGFIDELGPMDDSQVSVVKCACDAVKKLAEAANAIPNEGGWADKIFGENSLGKFADQLPATASAISAFVSNLTGFDDSKIAIVDCACDAIKKLAEAAGELPNEGGWAAAIFGENSIAKFADQLGPTATGISTFITNLGTFEDAQVKTVNCACNCIKKLAEAAQSIPATGGFWQGLVGEQSLATFAGELKSVAEGINGFVKKLGKMDDSVISSVNAASKVMTASAKLAKQASAIEDSGDNLTGLAKVVQLFVGIIDGVKMEKYDRTITKIKKITDLIGSVKKVDYSGLGSFGDTLTKFANDIVKGFVNKIKGDESTSSITKAAKTMVDAFKKAATSEDTKKSVKDKFRTLAKDAAGAMDDDSVLKKAKSAGKAVVDGFAKGITENTFKAEAKAKAMAENAYKAAKKQLDINSPSKVFRSLGYSVPEGFALGIDKMSRMATKSATGMADTAIDTVKHSIAKIASGVFSDIDSQPTIRPVLDLSDIEDGAGAIGGLFSNPSIGLMNKVNGISSSMSNRQNGNLDVVSAIEDLRKDLGNIGGTSYTINGVSYSGDSDVAAAIKVITRAATMERRI